VAFAITTEDPRYSMHGALLLLSKAAVTLVATDGFRLAYVSKKAAIAKQDAEERVIVPRKALTELAKMLSELAEGESIRFGRSGNQIFFVVGRHILTSTVPETVFPRYEEVMPKGCDTEIVVPTADLADAVRRVSLVASERLGKTIRFHFSHGEMELSSQTELGEAQEALPIGYQGEEKVVGFSARYLQEFLAVVASPSVRIELDPRRGGDEDEQRKRRSGDKQAQFRPEPSGDIDYRYIVMPRDL
jgi:DNA polymerase-3 subunit beta